MKNNSRNEVRGYEAPDFEIVSTIVERGFEASYGDIGEAGDNYDEKDWGEF